MRKAEYLKFEDLPVPSSRKTRLVHVKSASSDKVLGVIAWYSPWRQYTFHPNSHTIWNPDCLIEIATKVSAMTRDHKELLRRTLEKIEIRG